MSYGTVCDAKTEISAGRQYPGAKVPTERLELLCGLYEAHDGPHSCSIKFHDGFPVGMPGRQYIEWTDAALKDVLTALGRESDTRHKHIYSRKPTLGLPNCETCGRLMADNERETARYLKEENN